MVYTLRNRRNGDPGSRRPRPCRPLVERLEDRLPPGDTALAALLFGGFLPERAAGLDPAVSALAVVSSLIQDARRGQAPPRADLSGSQPQPEAMPGVVQAPRDRGNAASPSSGADAFPAAAPPRGLRTEDIALTAALNARGVDTVLPSPRRQQGLFVSPLLAPRAGNDNLDQLLTGRAARPPPSPPRVTLLPEAAPAVPESAYDPSRILVRFREGADVAEGSAPVAGTTVGKALAPRLVPGLREVRLDVGVRVADAVAAYSANPAVLYAEPNYYGEALDTIPNDPLFPEQWSLHTTGQSGGVPGADVDAPAAWDVTTGTGGTIVAVIDSGVIYSHPDLAANMGVNAGEIPSNGIDDEGNGFIDDVHGDDFEGDDGDPWDFTNGHGTRCAGQVGALGNNGLGVAGMAWQAQIMAVKIFTPSNATVSRAIAALDYVIANGATISSHSYGFTEYSQAYYDAVADARRAGHILTAAAGNSNVNNDFSPTALYPASFRLDNVISGAATDRTDNRASFSSYGRTTVHLGAPGVDILSTGLNNGYVLASGTSRAAPLIAGVAALVKDLHPEWTYNRVVNQVLSTVNELPALRDITVTGGRLNAARAVGPEVGPHVVRHSPEGTMPDWHSSLRLTFHEPINAASFTPADLTLAGPGGAVPVTAVTPVAGSGGRQFDIAFPRQSELGKYVMTVGPNLTGANGNRMDQDRDGTTGEKGEDEYTARFRIDHCTEPDGFGYTACAHPFEKIDLRPGAAGVFTILPSGNDVAARVDLGGNTVSCYGDVYASLFVSSNGLVTFDRDNTAAINTDLRFVTPTPAVAALWDDWRSTAGNPMVLGQLADDDQDGTPDRLILQGDRVQGGSGSPDTATFQAVFRLNTGSTSDIAFYYPDLATGDARAEGAQATVGVKSADRQGNDRGADRLLVSFDDASPWVGSSKALRLNAGPFGGEVRGHIFNDLNRDGTRDKDEPGLQRVVTLPYRVGSLGGDDVPEQVTAGAHAARVNARQTVTGLDFGNYADPAARGGGRALGMSPSGEVVEDNLHFVRFTFRDAMDTRSFDLSDVAAFTGPDGRDLRDQLAPFRWLDGRTLEVIFVSQSDPGRYTLTLGADIRRAADSAALDQNDNGLAGESGDGFTASVTLVPPCTAADGFGYRACGWLYEDHVLTPKLEYVFTALDDANDGAAELSLQGHTFTFYGTAYPSLWVSSNGLITFGAGNTVAANTNLTATPAPAGLAPLWDDWRTDLDDADQILARFEDVTGDAVPDRLVVQWSGVRHGPSSPRPVTFQAHLWLDGGPAPGAVVFNYADLDAANPAFDGGGSATVGLKAAGTQGANRLLVSFDSHSARVASRRALWIST